MTLIASELLYREFLNKSERKRVALFLSITVMCNGRSLSTHTLKSIQSNLNVVQIQDGSKASLKLNSLSNVVRSSLICLSSKRQSA
ncbi:hypothetical protein [Salmonella phage PHA46]